MNSTRDQHLTLTELDAQHDELLRQIEDLDKRVLATLAECQPSRTQSPESDQVDGEFASDSTPAVPPCAAG